MKKVVIFGIRCYQLFLSLPLRIIVGATFTCKFSPTCSEYAVHVINEYGAVRGGMMSLARLLSCQPFSSGCLLRTQSTG